VEHTSAKNILLEMQENMMVETIALLVAFLRNKAHFGIQSWPQGGDSFGIDRHFHCQILATPCRVITSPQGLLCSSQGCMRSQEFVKDVSPSKNQKSRNLSTDKYYYVAF
jgi:hypothetical protein